MEHDPAPPFDAGHPKAAGPERTAVALGIMGEAGIREGIEIAKSRRVKEPA